MDIIYQSRKNSTIFTLPSPLKQPSWRMNLFRIGDAVEVGDPTRKGLSPYRNSARPLIFWADGYWQNSGASRREIADSCLTSLRGAATKQSSFCLSARQSWIASLCSQWRSQNVAPIIRSHILPD
jgi:hypothetical protein